MKKSKILLAYAIITAIITGLGYLIGKLSGKGSPTIWALAFGIISLVLCVILWYTGGRKKAGSSLLYSGNDAVN